jgi:predicted O-linked N-acetylglucosamine transferase (SPINDLY family)
VTIIWRPEGLGFRAALYCKPAQPAHYSDIMSQPVIDPELAARALNDRPLSLYEAQSLIRSFAHDPINLFHVAELIRSRDFHRQHPKLGWLQPPVLYRACFLTLPTYAPPVLAFARGVLSTDFPEAERLLLTIFDVPTYDPAKRCHRVDHDTTVAAFNLLAPHYPLAFKTSEGERFHRLQLKSVEQSRRMAERVLALAEGGEIDVGRHLRTIVECCNVLARDYSSYAPVTDVRSSFASYHRGFQFAEKARGLSTANEHDVLQMKRSMVDAMGLVRYYFAHPGDRASIEAEERSWKAVVCDAFKPSPTQPVPPSLAATGRRIRIGYISPDFRSTAVGWFLTPLLKHFDRDRFEVFVYNNHTGDIHNDPARVMFRTMSQHWFESGKFSEDTLVDVLQTHNLDVLVDLLAYHRATLLARKPVKNILTYLGYPGKTYLEGVTGRVVDAVSDPPELATGVGEPLVYLPRSFLCFSPMSCFSPLRIAYEPAPVRGVLRLGVFNKSAKFTPSVISAWREILERRPDAELWVKRDERYMDPWIWEGFLELFGPCRKRIHSFPFTQRIEVYFSYLNRIDLTLDTWPYSGTTTTCSALYMGVPVITSSGVHHVERVTHSILRNAGLEQWVAGSGVVGEFEQVVPESPVIPPGATTIALREMPHREAYIHLAVSWPLPAERVEEEQARRERLRETFMASMNPDQFMREWETMIEGVVRR